MQGVKNNQLENLEMDNL